MDFSPFQNKEGIGSPAAQISRVQYSNQGEQALVQAQGETASVLTKGFTAMKDQVEQTQALAANNMYNKLMSEGTSELMQKKEEGALNLTDDYDKLQKKTMDTVFAKYKGVLRYGTGARAFNEFTERDNVTRRANVMRYQQEQLEAYKNTQYKNAVDVCLDNVLEYGGNDAAIDMAINRGNALALGMYGAHGEERVKYETELIARQAVGQAMSLAMQTADFKRMDEISNKYGKYMDPNQRTAALGAVRKHAQQEMEFNEAQTAMKELGIEASRDAVKAWVQKNIHGNTPSLDGMYAFFKDNIGKPYRLGGPEDGSGGTWDCGSFTKACGKTYGLNLSSRCADEQYVQLKEEGRAFSDPKDLRTGDLVFWTDTGGGEGQYGISHVGIYNAKTGKVMQSGNHGVAEIDLNLYPVVGFGRGVMETPPSEMEIEERTDKIFGTLQKQLAVRDREDNRLLEQGQMAIMQLQNDGQYHSVAEYQSVITSIAGDNPRVSVKLMNSAMKAGQADQARAEAAANRRAAAEAAALKISGPEYKYQLINALQTGKISINDAYDTIIGNPHMENSMRKELLDVIDDYKTGKGAFKYDWGSIKQAVKTGLGGYENGMFDSNFAVAQDSTGYLIREYQKDHNGEMPPQQWIIEKMAGEMAPMTISGSGGFFGFGGNKIDTNEAQLFNIGIASVVDAGNGESVVTLINGGGAYRVKTDDLINGMQNGKSGKEIVYGG
jgi:cell wall-associated NlpC family hydrolase